MDVEMSCNENNVGIYLKLLRTKNVICLLDKWKNMK